MIKKVFIWIMLSVVFIGGCAYAGYRSHSTIGTKSPKTKQTNSQDNKKIQFKQDDEQDDKSNVEQLSNQQQSDPTNRNDNQSYNYQSNSDQQQGAFTKSQLYNQAMQIHKNAVDKELSTNEQTNSSAMPNQLESGDKATDDNWMKNTNGQYDPQIVQQQEEIDNSIVNNNQ
ncbi:hypothetical protein ACQW5G_01220 [Fructilactobacillus sp. Tb1]|uniref:hypothetical protein n=1 Tax=Fructilactobacillus sp. Tb1 TaxID=3422304 RepID=UPI003D2E8182